MFRGFKDGREIRKVDAGDGVAVALRPVEPAGYGSSPLPLTNMEKKRAYRRIGHLHEHVDFICD